MEQEILLKSANVLGRSQVMMPSEGREGERGPFAGDHVGEPTLAGHQNSAGCEASWGSHPEEDPGLPGAPEICFSVVGEVVDSLI